MNLHQKSLKFPFLSGNVRTAARNTAVTVLLR